MHDHSHRHGDSNARIGLAFALNLSFTIIEFIGSLLTNSTAIKADAAHDWTSHDLVDTLPPFESLWAQPTPMAVTPYFIEEDCHDRQTDH